MAEKIGIATKTQSCTETGKNYPTAENIEKYAKAFNVNVEDILDIKHVKNPDVLLNEIYKMLKNAGDEQIVFLYKLLKALLY